MGFGQSAEGNAEKIRSQRCNGDMLLSIHNKPVVDFIRKNDQLMFSGDLHDLFQQFLRIQGTRGIVGIDNDQCFGAVRDL